MNSYEPILEGSPLEWPSTIEFTYNIWEISFPYSTLFEPIYVTTRIEAFLGAGAGVLLLGISVYLISHYSKLLQQFNMFTFRNGASISVSHKRRTD